ncbi:hypothetical protein [Comamonas sp. UBA7528]|jgi:hypothetical protein|uniref:hypothetical protein n=1 Tax=Comamonas sp. UBA7528 TaxID=1946391 RepID=UPI0025B8E568|nr:hypothetical protein [Comamonas sp. UBA7528]
MDIVLHLLGSVSSFLLRLLGFQLLFFWPGWLVLRLLTLGCYPRFLGPRCNAWAYEDVELVSCIGLVAVLLALALWAHYGAG